MASWVGWVGARADGKGGVGGCAEGAPLPQHINRVTGRAKRVYLTCGALSSAGTRMGVHVGYTYRPLVSLPKRGAEAPQARCAPRLRRLRPCLGEQLSKVGARGGRARPTPESHAWARHHVRCRGSGRLKGGHFQQRLERKGGQSRGQGRHGWPATHCRPSCTAGWPWQGSPGQNPNGNLYAMQRTG